MDKQEAYGTPGNIEGDRETGQTLNRIKENRLTEAKRQIETCAKGAAAPESSATVLFTRPARTQVSSESYKPKTKAKSKRASEDYLLAWFCISLHIKTAIYQNFPLLINLCEVRIPPSCFPSKRRATLGVDFTFHVCLARNCSLLPHLSEQLDGAGIELPSLYKLIEGQAPNGCCTEAWRKRAHWVGSQVSNETIESIAEAEKYLQTHRPVRRRHGKLLEEGASGFLQKKLADDGRNEAPAGDSVIDWSSLNKIFSDNVAELPVSFGSKCWAEVYLASTPQQAAIMGLKFPGVDEVEEIDDIDINLDDPFIADAIANERGGTLSDEQRKNFRKVKEEDDKKIDQKLQLCLKKRRYRRRSKQVQFVNLPFFSVMLAWCKI
ncbi:protein CHROMATIN REMODELING 20-like [Carica papaya]|uniref:protein CHROMATIN REMODELING 20-like n=1 Tax=Carica papaya TaxID=3649 RepID=UPI000B8CAA0D|nr:protein CHROMATIN REMODELING 20-like [Carica papaya]